MAGPVHRYPFHHSREAGVQIDHLQKCAHPSCICQVTQDQEFCSDHCREEAGSGGDRCSCGHAQCATEAVEQPA
jgi:hypothetical protein